MKLGKYILGLAIVAVGLTSCDQENVGAIYEPEVENVTFMSAKQNILTGKESIEVPVAISRAKTNGEYTANVSLADNVEGVSLKSQNVTFANGEGIAYATVVITGMEPGNEYAATVKLSDKDAATANTTYGRQITSTTITVKREFVWNQVGTCFVVDGWYTGMYAAEDVPVMHADGTNLYRLSQPLYYVYKDVDPTQTCTADLEFTLNEDGSISIPNGTMPLYYMDGADKYYGYFTTDYPGYCYIEQDGNTYAINFLFLNGEDLYLGGYFEFTWIR